MAEILASAVVVPQTLDPEAPDSAPLEGTDPAANASTGSKRRRASVSSDDSKRPRLNNDTNARPTSPSPNTDEPSTGGSAQVPTEQVPNATRRQSLQDKEKGRAKRLFGGLLSTLAQGGAQTNASQRRAEIEARQREKLRRQQAEADKEHSEILKVRRAEQQKRWDRESLRIRHASMRARARFLTTEAQPPVHWLPYTLTTDQQNTIDRQVDQVEDDIERETADLERLRSDAELPASRGVDRARAASPADASRTSPARAGPSDMHDTPMAVDAGTNVAADDGDEDHVVEAGEDSVIY